MDDLPELSTTPAWREAMRSARKGAGLTQGSLALKVGVSQALVSGIEQGTIGQSTAVMKICTVLHISPPMPGVDAEDFAALSRFRQLRQRFPERFRGVLAVVDGMLKDDEKPPGPSKK